MGAKSSKTKPGDESDAAVAVEKDTLVQEIGLGSGDLSFKSVKSEREKPDDGTGHKVGKVQEIMEARALQLGRRGSSSSVVKPLELQVSSSEDSSSDASEHGRDNERTKKRRKRKKHKQKIKAPAAATAVTPASSPKGTTNLNAVKNVTRLQALPPKQNYFEEIKVAYSLTEYEGKDAPPTSASPKPEPAKAGFFSSPFDGWKRHVEIALKGSSGISRQSTRSTRSVGRSEPRERIRPPEPKERPRQLESKDKARAAAMTPPRSTTPLKTNSASLGRFMEWDKGTFRSSGRESESPNSDPMADLDDLERETSSALAEFPRSMNQLEKADETRVAKRPTSSREPEPKPQRPVTPDLHIDDVDESIMNDILAEVVV